MARAGDFQSSDVGSIPTICSKEYSFFFFWKCTAIFIFN